MTTFINDLNKLKSSFLQTITNGCTTNGCH